MYDDAELDTTFSERACQIWVHPTAHSSGSSTLRPRLKRVRDGRREALALVLTEELEKKIQTALALGRGHIHAVQDVKRWKHETRLKQADNKGSLESFTHRFNAKCAEIQPNKEPTEFQKKTLKMLAQSVERTKANQDIMDETIANYDRDLARGLNRWRKAWADIDKILAKVWTDAGRLVPDDDSDADNERPPRATESKNEAGRNGGRANIPGDNLPLAAPVVEPARQRQAGRRRSDISEWQNSVEAQSPTNLDKGKGASRLLDAPITLETVRHLRARPNTLVSIREECIGHIRRARRRRRRRLPHHHAMATMSPCPAMRDNKRMIMTRIANDGTEVDQAVQDENEVHLETHQNIGNVVTAKVSSIGLTMKAPGG
ncbi:hypothetical protein J4E85_007551 [Alternaria conjuncta]|uniref:uncharacterized protein n=1 Tax=Alternaria conjuncta TaxID=181017 RepID=UPI00221F4C4A|nr:uncharacterized protein J4E85_007551 [Alternaria conjuncta]KAI4925672.1 hypothetical protein J4E85_007551 [Alternaria conjuncta]